jgi:hypothetical protein
LNTERSDDGDDQDQTPRGQLASGRPAKDSAGLDRWNVAGEFAPAPVTLVKEGGERVVRIAAPDPLLPQPRDSDLVKDLKANAAAPPAHPRPTAVVQVGKPSDKPPAPKQSPPAKPYVRPDDRAEGIGRGTVRPGGYKMA